MKITKDNYFKQIKQVEMDNMTKEFKDDHAYVIEVTDNDSDWSFYEQSGDIREVIDHQFATLESLLANSPAKKQPEKPKTKAKSKPVAANKKNTGSKPAVKVTVTAEEKNPAEKQQQTNPQQVVRIDEEVRFIKRYALLHGKMKNRGHILSFISALQKAILEKRIRKTSPYAGEINYIQEKLIGLYKGMGKKEIEIQLGEDVLERFRKIAASKKVRLSIGYLKRYIGIQGKTLTKEKAEALYRVISSAMNKHRIGKGDPYFTRLSTVKDSLEKFIRSASASQTLEIHPGVLNGLDKALSGLGCDDKDCECRSLNGLGDTSPDGVMNSIDFANMKFERLGFTGKWLEFIGDPAKRFTAMVFGRPKMGKSYLCVELAGYLARNFGKVLYVAREEKLDATLQDKLNDTKVKHSNLFVSDDLPEDLSPYRFVFLDSVNKLGLSPVDLEGLKTAFSQTSFIYVFQTTKEGNFRGANAFQHDVDVVIEVPELGRAVQFGRFNQGGEMEIFRQAA